MRKLLMLSLFLLLPACMNNKPEPVFETTKEVYPYGMTEKEWNELSIKDKAKMRRDFYFYEKGHTKFVNPDLEVEGAQDDSAWKKK